MKEDNTKLQNSIKKAELDIRRAKGKNPIFDKTKNSRDTSTKRSGGLHKRTNSSDTRKRERRSSKRNENSSKTGLRSNASSYLGEMLNKSSKTQKSFFKQIKKTEVSFSKDNEQRSILKGILKKSTCSSALNTREAFRPAEVKNSQPKSKESTFLKKSLLQQYRCFDRRKFEVKQPH